MKSSVGCVIAIVLSVLSLLPARAAAGSATWKVDAVGHYGVAANWTPETVPNGPTDTATFGFSNTTEIPIGLSVTLDTMAFTADAPAYSFSFIEAASPRLTFTGTGIVDASAQVPSFAVTGHASTGHGAMFFTNSSSAGPSQILINGGFITFDDSSTAAGAAISDLSGSVSFDNASTAGHSTIVNGASPGEAVSSGEVDFFDTASAGSATITSRGSLMSPSFGSGTQFFGSSTAGSATLIATEEESNAFGAAIINFFDSSDGGTSHVVLSGSSQSFGATARLDLTIHNAPGLTIGSLAGEGFVLVGGNTLSIGSNNTSTTFAGNIREDDRDTKQGGSVAKIGTGVLTLSGINPYSGPTTVDAGELAVSGSLVSKVTVNPGGTLGGSGKVGNVVVNGTVAPGGPRTLTVDGSYDQLAGSTLSLIINGASPVGTDRVVATGAATIASGATLTVNFSGGFAPKAGDAFTLLSAAQITGTFGTVNITGLKAGFQYRLATDGHGNLVLTALNKGIATTDPVPSNLLNISTRADVLTGDEVLIAGFIIEGAAPKKVAVRALGPSLAGQGVTGVLANPKLELHEPDGTVFSSDSWMQDPAQEQAILDAGLAPSDPAEAALVETLAPGAYTVIVSGVGETTGVGLVEVYDLDESPAISLANISTRGFVDVGDNVMIGGFIAAGGGGNVSTIIVRGLGPSLTALGVANALVDPALELHDGDGTVLASNDDWMEGPDEAEIAADGLAPKNAKESALLARLAAGNYTAVLRGVAATTGVGQVEVYNVK